MERERAAVGYARTALENTAQRSIDHSSNPIAFREDLLNIAKTTLTSKLLNVEKIILLSLLLMLYCI